MGKRRSAFDAAQLALDLRRPEPLALDGELAGIERQIAGAVGLILNESMAPEIPRLNSSAKNGGRHA